MAKREGLEDLVNKDVEALKISAGKFDPENAQLGIDLIRAVRARFAGSSKFHIRPRAIICCRGEAMMNLKDLTWSGSLRTEGVPRSWSVKPLAATSLYSVIDIHGQSALGALSFWLGASAQC